MKTIQEQYNQIKKGKGSKEIFLKEVKRNYPHMVINSATFNQAEEILLNRSVISENIAGVVTQSNSKPDWFKIFDENMEIIKEANPKSIHIRITSPPIYYPCYYGMDFPSKEELIANRFDNVEKIREHLGVDSLEYMTEDELLESMVDHEPSEFCTACFTGKYPIPIKDLELIK